ncbi:hypothetical protein BDD12DRAFT_803774 [Trichophaea hybrida]|nr:hypothetical protein BDD12DRAFT_803774 [Trichophaea hybrida]
MIFSPIVSATQHRAEFHSPSGELYTFDNFSSNRYKIPSPSFDAAANRLDISVIGPPGEIVIYARSTNISWDNRTVYTKPFIEQPKIRGTLSILLEYAFTLFLCQGLAKILLVCDHHFPRGFTLFAQFENHTATRICELIGKKRLEIHQLGEDQWKKELLFGYFVLMGGFAIKDGNGNLKTLTSDGVFFICQYLPREDELKKLVEDKNKTSLFAKFERGAVGDTYGHTCAVRLNDFFNVVKKPFDVKHPIELELNNIIKEALGAYMESPDGKEKSDYLESMRQHYEELKKRHEKSHKLGERSILNESFGHEFKYVKSLSYPENILNDSQELQEAKELHIPLITERMGQKKLALRVLSGGESSLPDPVRE